MSEWFLKKGKNDGKSFEILWESRPPQQQLLPSLEMFAQCWRLPQPTPASASGHGPGRGTGPLPRQGGLASSASVQPCLQVALASELTSTQRSGACLCLTGESLLMHGSQSGWLLLGWVAR